jgi:hypothetical protein
MHIIRSKITFTTEVLAVFHVQSMSNIEIRTFLNKNRVVVPASLWP